MDLSWTLIYRIHRLKIHYKVNKCSGHLCAGARLSCAAAQLVNLLKVREKLHKSTPTSKWEFMVYQVKIYK